MQPFITYREEDKNRTLQYYILQKTWPHYLAVISDHPVIDRLGISPISSYSLYVVNVGTLQGPNMIPAQHKIWEEIQAVTDAMSDWFYINRILTNPSKYKKWRLQNVQSANQQPDNIH